MANELTTKPPGFFARMWARFTGKALPTVVLEDEEQFRAGASFVEGATVKPAYDPQHALSTYGAFPWVRACADAISEDLTSLPRRVVVGYGEDAEVYEDHPALWLLRRPNRHDSGVIFARQRVVDWLLSGNALRAIGGAESGHPVSLHRMHPELWAAEVGPTGGIETWQGQTKANSYKGAHVLHDRFPSWLCDSRSVLGESLIRPLDRDLTTDVNAADRAAKMSAAGQPQALLSPDPADPRSKAINLSDEQRAKYRRAFERAVTRSGSGLVVVDQPWKLEKLGFSPRDMEFKAVREWGRDSVLGGMSVPPSRVGLPTANYATQRQQMRTYWEGLRGKAAVLDDTDSRLARLFTDWARANLGSGWQQKIKTLRVETVFDGVEALQESRTERAQRVSLHIMNGVPSAAAYAAEGFHELAGALQRLPQAPPAEPEEEPAEEEETEERQVANGSPTLTLFTSPRPAVVKADEPPQEDAEDARRSRHWFAYIERTHAPLERSLQRALYAGLRAQAEHLAEKLPALLDGEKAHTKALSEDQITELLDIAESMGIVRAAALEEIRKALQRGVEDALSALDLAVSMDVARLQALLDAQLGTMIVRILPATKAAVRTTIATGLDQGLTTSEIQALLMDSPGFGPVRALRIARTETTTALETGADSAYDIAADAGVQIELEWITARDGVVRDSHVPMDGTRKQPGEHFTSGAGNTTTRPGAFGVAGEDINCRCTRVPHVIERNDP